MVISFREDKIDYPTFERLYSEAWDYISAERQRAGSEKLKQSLWESHNSKRSFIIEKDGYVVGIECFEIVEFQGQKVLHYHYPTFGADSDGSKSWYYSEEYDKAHRKRDENLNVSGVIIIGNPNSPAVTALKKKHAAGGDHFESMVEYPIEELSPVYAKSYPSYFKGYFLRKKRRTT